MIAITLPMIDFERIYHSWIQLHNSNQYQNNYCSLLNDKYVVNHVHTTINTNTISLYIYNPKYS